MSSLKTILILMAMQALLCASAGPAQAAPSSETYRIEGSVERATPAIEFAPLQPASLPHEARLTPYIGALNGDNTDDVLLLSHNDAGAYALLSSSQGHTLIPWALDCKECAAALLDHPGGPSCGRLVLYNAEQRTLSRGECTGGGCRLSTFAHGVEAAPATLRAADMNGDGADDITFFNSRAGTWHIFLAQHECGYRETMLAEPADIPVNLHAASSGSGSRQQLLFSQVSGPNIFSIALLPEERLELRVLGAVSKWWRWSMAFGGAFLEPDTTSILVWSQADASLRHVAFDSLKRPQYALLAQFPDAGWWRTPIAGDFTGDRRQDLLLSPQDGRYWWLVSAEPETSAFEVALPQADTFSVGDFDGDGRKDLLAMMPENKVWIGLSRQSWAVPQALVYLDNGRSTRADRGGKFVFEDLPAGELQINALHPDYDRFTPIRVSAGSPGESGRLVVLRGRASGRNSFQSPGRTGDGPQICAGFPGSNTIFWGRIFNDCPPHHAALEVDDQSSSSSPRHARVLCCPLPSHDILTEHHEYHEQSCPDGFVVTGGTIGMVPGSIRCTRINDTRYLLGPARKAVYWGVGFSEPKLARRIDKSSIPAALRYGAGRNSRTTWDPDGCIGEPAGSLFTGQTGGPCELNDFRQLLYRGKGGDPAPGTPVAILPDCAALASPYTPPPRCVQ